jgi:hypothetical protein
MRYAALLLVALALTSCSTYEDESQRAITHDSLGFPAAFTTADLRIITQRRHPVTGQEVVCTEPSPDVAKAVSAAFSSSLQGSGGTGSPSGSGSLAGATAEAVAELAGRSTALLGLRDGLFQACQAYANGAIGADIYALIVSRYGQLMTTLFLGQDIAGVGTAAAKSTTSPLVTASQNTPSNNGSTPSNTSNGAGAPSNTGGAAAPGGSNATSNGGAQNNQTVTVQPPTATSASPTGGGTSSRSSGGAGANE